MNNDAYAGYSRVIAICREAMAQHGLAAKELILLGYVAAKPGAAAGRDYQGNATAHACLPVGMFRGAPP